MAGRWMHVWRFVYSHGTLAGSISGEGAKPFVPLDLGKRLMKRLDLTAGVVDGLSMKEDLDLIQVLFKSSWDELTMRGKRARSARGDWRVGGTTR